mmetsp:Transcript_16690/g.32399  ORF Transcript_16690/g.32399 Transcript_16690/m.32399 type:complete len:973 (-) Transcript_16690:702-3620(-)
MSEEALRRAAALVETMRVDDSEKDVVDHTSGVQGPEMAERIEEDTRNSDADATEYNHDGDALSSTRKITNVAADVYKAETLDSSSESRSSDLGTQQLFAYLYASPLTQHGQDGNSKETEEEVEALNVTKEAEDLLNMFDEEGKELRFRVEVATRESLRRTLQSESANCSADVIHFTCHGRQDFLALEDGAGQLDELNADDLKNMLNRDRMPDVVFVSACFSEFIGHIFAEAGVKHVVAVVREVADKVGKDFAERFYRELINGQTVKWAFEAAWMDIAMTPNRDAAWVERQRGKFKLLPEFGMDHDVPVFDSERFGRVRVETPLKAIKFYPRNIGSSIIGRGIVVQRIVQAIAPRELCKANQNRPRWITVCGTEGIGKSVCTILACNYVSQRRHCKAIYYIHLADPNNAGVSHGIQGARAALLKAFRSNSMNRSDLSTASSEADLFKGLNELTKDYAAYPGDLIVVLDGCTQWARWSSVAQPALESFIKDLLAACPEVTVLCTSGTAISPSCASVWSTEAHDEYGLPREHTLEVLGLSTRYAAQLLLQRTQRQIKGIELGDSLFDKKTLKQKCEEVLAHHPVIHQCRGHPLVIGAVAEKLNRCRFNDSDVEETARSTARRFFSSAETSSGSIARTHNINDRYGSNSTHMQESLHVKPGPAAPGRRVPPDIDQSQQPQHLNHQHIPSHHIDQQNQHSHAPSSNGLGVHANNVNPPSNFSSFSRSRGSGQQLHANGSNGMLDMKKRHDSRTTIPSSYSGSCSSGLIEDDWVPGFVDAACTEIEALPDGRAMDMQWDAVLQSTRLALHDIFDKNPQMRRSLSQDDLYRMRSVYDRCYSTQGHISTRRVVESFAKWLCSTVKTLLENAEYWNHNIIYGLVAKEKVNEMLLSKSPGTFMIRVSESVPGSLAVAYHIHPHGSPPRVVHSLVAMENGGKVSLEFRNGRKHFDSLRGFLMAHAIFAKLYPEQEKQTVLHAL